MYIYIVSPCKDSVGPSAAILDSPTLPQQEGTGLVVRLFQKGPAESQPPNPLNTKFATGVDL